jgi:hypothetical protein
MRRAGFTTDGKSPAFCATQGEPHRGERPDMDVRAGPQRGRSRSVAGKAQKGSPAASMDGSTAVRDMTGLITLLAGSSS